MKKVKYSIAIQTYMEVFDFLITNDLLVFDTGKDFLKARIRIGKYGFIKETQVARGVWDEKPKIELVPAIYVLNIITKNIDDILSNLKVPTSPNTNYAYINDTKTKLSGKKDYYKSYTAILEQLKKIKEGQELLFNSDGKVIDFNLAKLKDLNERFSKLSPLEIRTIECYARLEEELIHYTAELLLIDEDGYPIDDFRKDFYLRNDPNYPPRFANMDSYVYWDEFKELITANYLSQKEENNFDINGAYSSFETNPYKSKLGLDGRTI